MSESVLEKTKPESPLQKVTMNLTSRDVQNTNRLKEILDARSNAQAVSNAISLAFSVADILKDGGELLVKDKNGELQRVIVPGIN